MKKAGEEKRQGRDCRKIPALTLLDLKLAKVHGLEVLRRIRGDTETRRMPVVIPASSSIYCDVAGSYELIANSFLSKPVDFRQFVTTAELLGRYWLQLNCIPSAVE